MAAPSPDWDMVTFKWAGNRLDGKPATGSISVHYDGGVMLDDDNTPGGTPVSVFPVDMTFPITTAKITVGGQLKDVGYVEFQVPASNDPDITGGGGTYTITEQLQGTNSRRVYTVVADRNAPSATVWLSKVAPTAPTPGTPLSVVYYAEFADLSDRVALLEANPPASTWATLSGKPATFPPTIGTTATTAKAGNYVPAWAEVTGKPSTFAPTIGTTATTAKAGNYKPPVADLPAGSMLYVVNVDGTQARPTSRSDISVLWIGGTVAPTNGVTGVDVWVKDLAP